jgi:phage protein D
LTPTYLIFADGINVTAGFNGRLLDIKIKDEAGLESDTLSITVDDRNGELALPRDGAVMGVSLGYEETGVYFMGAFTVDDVTSKGGDSGQTIAITARAVDTRKALKEKRDKHYDDKTLGDILQEEAGEHGLQAVVSDELASFKYDYLPKRGQSLLHFGTQLALRHDATFKIAGGKLIFAKRGAGLSVSGLGLPVVPVTRPGNLIDWSIKPKIGRPRYGKGKACWYDREKAKRVIEDVASGNGPDFVIGSLHQNKSEAKAAAGSKKSDLDRKKAGGSFTIVGNPFVVAETMVIAAGCREGVDGEWLAKSVEHSYTDSGYVTKITVETPEGKK